jgi:hypothetical protein
MGDCLMGAAVQRSYNLEEIELGLSELAIWFGNSRQASRTLADKGIEIPRSTLEGWQRQHPERYAELQEQVVPIVRERLAQLFETSAMRSVELTLKGLDRMDEEFGEIPARDLAGAIRNISTAGAIGIDKASLLRGLPTEIRQTDSAEDILKRLAQKHPGMFVEGSAEEIPEAEVVEEKAPKGRVVVATSAAYNRKRTR